MKRTKTKPKEKEIIPSSWWWCNTCQSPQMSHPQMLEHLKTAHGLEVKGLKCQKRMLMHMDGPDWFSYQWEFSIVSPSGAEIKLSNSTVNKRTPEDAAFWK